MEIVFLVGFGGSLYLGVCVGGISSFFLVVFIVGFFLSGSMFF